MDNTKEKSLEKGSVPEEKYFRIELCDLKGPDGDLLANVAGKSLNPTWPPRKNKKESK